MEPNEMIAIALRRQQWEIIMGALSTESDRYFGPYASDLLDIALIIEDEIATAGEDDTPS